MEELGEVQKKGYAKDYEGYTLGLNAVASPVFKFDGKVLFVPSLIIPTSDAHLQKMDEYCLKIHRLAEELTVFIGGKLPFKSDDH